MTSLGGLAFALLLSAAQGAPGGTPAEAGQRIFAASGYIGGGGAENGGWFQFMQSAQRFRLPANAGEAETIQRLLLASFDRGVALRVHYDARAGRADAEGGYVEYPLCSLSTGTGASFGDTDANCPAGAAGEGGSEERALALGLAMVDTQPAEAGRLLGVALDGGRLAPNLRATAFRARGEMAESDARNLPLATEAYDRALAAALADFRDWVAIAPDEILARYSVARVLMGLGGYPDARAIYRAIGRRWPEESFMVSIRSGALYRQEGRYQEALSELDAIVARDGPQRGMVYNYHRAWTLNLLDRPREAVEALAVGLEAQPDYAFAYLMRSCAYAKLGRIEEALADQERAMTVLGEIAADNPAGVAESLAAGRSIVAELRRLVAAGGRSASNAPCDRHWYRDIRRRPRSALLGPPAD